MVLQQSETRLGDTEHNKVTSKIEKASESGNKRNAYRKYTSQECYEIGNYAAERDNSTVIKHFKSKNLKESNVRTFKSKYHGEINHAGLRNIVQRKY